MDIVVALDFRFHTTPDGSVWTSTAYSHSFWTRYLEVFDRVRIVARAATIRRPGPGDRRVDGEGVSLAPIPFYLGPVQYLMKAREVRRAVVRAVAGRDAVILRVGSQLATCLTPSLWRANHPASGLLAVGDPYDAFAPGAIRHPLRPFFRWRNTRMLRQQCARACGAAYVTETALQRRYTCPGYAAAVSDVELAEEFWTGQPDRQCRSAERSLIFVGSLEQMYKAPDVLLDALTICVRTDPAFSLTLIGEGRYLPEMQRRAVTLGVDRWVRFLGGLPAGAAVRDQLDKSCLFVLPSGLKGFPAPCWRQWREGCRVSAPRWEAFQNCWRGRMSCPLTTRPSWRARSSR